MPLRPPSPPPGNDQRKWDQWARSVEITPDPGSVGTEQIKDDAVTGPKLRNSAALSVMGNPTGSPADPQDIGAPSNGTFLRRKADGLAFGAIEDEDLPATIARDDEVADAIEEAIQDHLDEPDPHPVYTTATELSSAIAALNLASGTYTPVLTGVSNVDDSTAYACQYLRVGSVCTVSGKLDVEASSAADTRLGISLPIASALTDAGECAGTGAAEDIQQVAVVTGDPTNDRAELRFIAADDQSHTIYFTFTFQII